MTPRQILGMKLPSRPFKDIKNSVLFWNTVGYITFIVILITNVEIAEGISGILSLLLVCQAFDSPDLFEREPNKHFWAPMAFAFWVVILLFLIGVVIYYLYDWTIGKFNRWLDKEPKQIETNAN